jgi:hypothetical protein
VAAGKGFGMPTQRMDRHTRETAGAAAATTRPQRPNDAASEGGGGASERGHDCNCRRGRRRGCSRHLSSACQDDLAGQLFVAPMACSGPPFKSDLCAGDVEDSARTAFASAPVSDAAVSCSEPKEFK